jgi:D-alanine-D-alanine ligase
MPDGSRRTKPKILVINNENPTWPEHDRLAGREMLKTLTTGLSEQGYEYQAFIYFDDLSVLDGFRPDEWLIWNWGEELNGQPWTEAEVAAELERRGFAYTGASPAIFRTVQSRAGVKQRLRAAGLPTLPARVFHDPARASEWSLYPAIVKGANQHASYGISGQSVVRNAAELASRIEYLRADFADDALVEPFLDTREFHVAVWGNAQPEALPPMELDYSMFDDMRDRLYTYDWKFDRESRGYREMGMPCPAPLDRPDWQARLMAVAVEAYNAIGLRDYGRVDMRMLGDEPQILDVNANPDLDEGSVLPISSKVAGYSYGAMLDRIARCAAERMPLASNVSQPAKDTL